MRTSPAAVVFGTYEVLEAILYELPISNVLLAQRVDRQFQAVITDSTKLQQALFLQPIPFNPIENEDGAYKVWKNPILKLLLREPREDHAKEKASGNHFEKYLLSANLRRHGNPFHRSWNHPVQAKGRCCLVNQCYEDASLMDRFNISKTHAMSKNTFRMEHIIAGLRRLLQQKTRKRSLYSVEQHDAFHYGRFLKKGRQLEEVIEHCRRNEAKGYRIEGESESDLEEVPQLAASVSESSDDDEDNKNDKEQETEMYDTTDEEAEDYGFVE